MLLFDLCVSSNMMCIEPSLSKKPNDEFKFTDKAEQMFLRCRTGWFQIDDDWQMSSEVLFIYDRLNNNISQSITLHSDVPALFDAVYGP